MLSEFYGGFSICSEDVLGCFLDVLSQEIIHPFTEAHTSGSKSSPSLAIVTVFDIKYHARARSGRTRTYDYCFGTSFGPNNVQSKSEM